MNQLEADLRAIKALIDTPEKWCKGKFFEHRPMGLACCINGAGMKALPDESNGGEGKWRRWAAMDAIMDAVPHDMRHRDWEDAFISDFNDHPRRTHAQVMFVLDLAIERARDQ